MSLKCLISTPRCCSFTATGESKAKQAIREAATRHAKLADIGAGETEALKAMDTLVTITNECQDNFVHTPEEVCIMLSYKNSLCRV